MLGKSGQQSEKRVRESGAQPSAGAVSVITKDLKITGDCITEGTLVVHGKIAGSVTAGSLEVAAGGVIEGDVAASQKSAGSFVVDGTVAGSVRAPKVRVGMAGCVEGGLEADDAEIHGKVRSGITARNRLALKGTAVVAGDVLAKRVSLEEGGEVNGTLRMGDAAAPAPRKAAGGEGGDAQELVVVAGEKDDEAA